MERVWITNGSTSIAPIVNSLTAACEDGFLPTDIYMLSNPQIDEVTEQATTLMKTIVTAKDGVEPSVTVTEIEDETDFDEISMYLQSAIEAGQEAGAEIAVDITPGRRFWSVISFRAGLKYDVKHLVYTHVTSERYFGECYPEIPRTAIELIDFTEVL